MSNNNILEQALYSYHNQDGRVFHCAKLAELFGTTELNFTCYTWDKGWLELCNHSDALSAGDVFFLAISLAENTRLTKTKWPNRTQVLAELQKSAYAKIYEATMAERADLATNGLGSRIQRKAKSAVALQNTVDGHTKQLIEHSNRIASLEADNVSLKADNVSLNNKYASLSADHIKLEAIADEHTKRLIEHSNKLAIQDKELGSLKAEHSSLKAEHSSLKAEHSSLKAEHGSLSNKYASLEAEHVSLEAIVANHAKQIASQDAKINELIAGFANVRSLMVDGVCQIIDKYTAPLSQAIKANVVVPMKQAIQSLAA